MNARGQLDFKPIDANASEREVEELAKKSTNIIFKAQNVFPFDFFPDEIIIDKIKISIITQTFFGTERVYSINIDQIEDALIEMSPFFAALKIIDRRYPEKLITFDYLKKEEGIQALQIIKGLILSQVKKINLEKISPDKLAQKLSEAGKSEDVRL